MENPSCRRNSNASYQAITSFMHVSLLLSIPSVSAFSSGLWGSTSVPLRVRGQTGNHINASTKARLLYRKSEEDPNDGATADLGRTTLNNWRQHLFPPAAQVPVTDQDRVDEYLAFLDKRYHRLHESEQHTKKQFNVMGWLKGDGSVTTDTKVEEDQESALFVLGVAELASDRLLQNLHIKVQQEKETAAKQTAMEMEGVINAQFSSLPISDDTSQTKMTAVTLIQAGSAVLSRIGARRAAFIAYQNRQMERALRFVAKTAVIAPMKIISAIWHFGGGKKSIALTLSILTTAMLLLVPLLQFIAKTVIVNTQSA